MIKPKVTLLSHTPNPEIIIASAARLCYSPSTIEQIGELLDDQKAADYVMMLSELHHESPIEHVSFTFGIEGVSRSFLAQITRHRIASYSVQSQRYVAEGNFEYVTPPEIAGIKEAEDEYTAAMQAAQKSYDRLTELLFEKHFKRLLAEGKDEKTAKGAAVKQAIEDARFVLPNACDTKMIVTMNARSLHNFFRHRCCNRAQWEIREVADMMLALARQTAPTLFAFAGAPCAFGACPEGKMSCGKQLEMKEKYASFRKER